MPHTKEKQEIISAFAEIMLNADTAINQMTNGDYLSTLGSAYGIKVDIQQLILKCKAYCDARGPI
jgi:hypothetical protein